MSGLALLGAADARVDAALPSRTRYPFDVFADNRFRGTECSLRGFAKLAVVTFNGDFGQLPPVKDRRWWDPPKTNAARACRNVVRKLAYAYSLRGSVRQQGDVCYADLLWRVHEGDGSSGEADWRLLNGRSMPELTSEKRSAFQGSAMRCYAAKKDATQANLEKIRRGFLSGELPAMACAPAWHNVRDAKSVDSTRAGGLEKELWLALGARYMVTTNLYTDAGVVNGIIGELWDLVVDEDPWQGVTSATVAILKAQCGILFTGLSRVPALSRLALSAAIDYSRLQAVYKSDAIRKRKAWERSWDGAADSFRSFFIASAQEVGCTEAVDECVAAQHVALHHGFGAHFLRA
ncbi:unnamed protein product [Prorocentrum cordatum]|uniref:ATP-dependent DNA helicase n=1 Tax=Prorocentrum cordatum TaxID=2364126 RepID=A0ABN9X278_9DINO|nr:unnamed protein product [Polarella glacialis]